MRHGLVHAGERLGTSSLTVVAIILLSDVPCHTCEECELGGVGIIVVRMNS